MTGDGLLGAGARRVRALARTARGRRGRAAARTSPLALVDDAPPEIAEAIGGATVAALPASPPPKRHSMFVLGEDRVLHVFGAPADRTLRSVDERRQIDALGVRGIPRLQVAILTAEHLWLVEDRVQGTPADRLALPGWFQRATELLVEAAGPPGPRLDGTAFWSDHRDQAVDAAPAEVRSEVEAAWEALGPEPARVLHGDVQPRNLLIGDGTVGLVDWEGAWRHGLPGADLLFLALMASPPRPDHTVARALFDDEDPPGRPVLEALAAVGVDGRLRRAAVVAALSVFNLGEARRHRRGGHAGHATPFRSLLAGA